MAFEDLDRGRLPRPVLAEECVDLADLNVERYAGDRVDVAIVFVKV